MTGDDILVGGGKIQFKEQAGKGDEILNTGFLVADADICVDASVQGPFTDPSGPVASIVFWQVDWKNYYELDYSPDGTVGLVRVQNGRNLTPIPWQSTPSLKQGAGAVNSIRQLCTGRKIPFQRTPKVDGRTAATPWHVAGQWALFLLACSEAPLRLVAGEWLAGLFFLTWAVALGYALHAFIGWRAALEDLFAGVEPRRLLLSRAILDGSFAPQLEADP